MGVTWAISSSASWLHINASSGAVAGTPTATGIYSFTIIAHSTEYGTSITQTFSVNVAAASSSGDNGGVVSTRSATSPGEAWTI